MRSQSPSFRLDTLGQGRFLNHNGTTYPGGESAIQAPGQLGQELYFNDKQVLALTDPAGTITQLRNGRYQEVLSKAASTAAPAAGLAAYWDGSVDDFGNYIVTPDENNGIVVGFYISAVAKGKYGFIQKSGATWIKGASSITKSPPVVGDLVSITSVGLADVLADATAITFGNLQDVVGKALGVVTANTLGLVLVPDGNIQY